MKILEYLYKIEEFAAILLFIVVSIIIFSHVVARYIFKSPFYFTEEISKYCFIWMVMICAS
ncbi:MAG: TRAP transporter small permease subunit, partial [Desulfobacteraceae bacterium]|nr:TRAP transporter small permease subunit [Desulfobacteraceae bacterium]